MKKQQLGNARTSDDFPLVYLEKYESRNLYFMLHAGHSLPTDHIDASLIMLKIAIG